MIARSLFPGYVVTALILIAGCKQENREQASLPTTSPSAAPVPPPPPTPSAQPAASAVPAKVDTVDSAALKAGLDVMRPRVKSQVDAYAKVAPNERNRFFMHPDESKNAVLELDVKGLTSITLAPYIEDFGTATDCMGTPKAGVVLVTWSLDGGKATHLTVDRTYNGLVPLDVSKASRLKLEVDKGNDVTWCDWFSVGFVDVK